MEVAPPDFHSLSAGAVLGIKSYLIRQRVPEVWRGVVEGFGVRLIAQQQVVIDGKFLARARATGWILKLKLAGDDRQRLAS